MKCPRCGAENPNDVKFCVQCGLSRTPIQTDLNHQKQSITNNTDYNIPMGFHNFFSIATLCVAVLMLLIGIIGSCVEGEATPGLVVMLPAAFYLIMSILLIKRKKAGNILRLIVNIWAIVQSSISLIIVIVSTIIFTTACFFISASEAEIALILTIALVIAILLIFMFIFACIEIAIHALIIYYYHKRKHMFN